MIQNNPYFKQEDYYNQLHTLNMFGGVFKYTDVVYSELKSAELYYPDFKNWYYSKVVPDLLLKNRSLLVEKRQNNIAGIAIIKNTIQEKKLCTLKIIDQYQNRGIGLKLFEKTFEELETTKPYLTVSEEKMVEFKKIFNYYNFELTSVKKDLYRAGKVEFIFNETN